MGLVKAFRLVALAEATSFMFLLVAALLKRQDQGEVGVQILGPIHGALFIAYVGLALLVAQALRWRVSTTALVLAGAIVPLGGYAVDLWLARRGRRASSSETGK
jgi:integral membrane protein